MQRAYSKIEFKASEDTSGRRTFTGIATTPSTDRVGDIVEPRGAQFELPLPLLWQHDSAQPIGWVRQAKVSDKGIDIVGEVATVAEAGALRDRLEEAWQTLRAGLVRGLSIGFSALESARIESTYAYRYLKWSWLELSCVTVPANADCSISAIKSLDQAHRRAAFGARPVVWLGSAPPANAGTGPGVSGPANRRRGAVYL